ncbi:hypothetical protein LIER_24855 [Lithospermum erythrorhizon]|uniref:GAG-pre-integrase domain-containing protein n=1 Tax=Lithospermum erythrorhizon TaxID=34254 RepID=A0AAV3R2H6_LITER
MIGNGALLPVSHTGKASISSVILHDILLVPALTKNLISIRKLCSDNECIAQFSSTGFCVKDPSTMITLLQSSSFGSLYPIKSSAVLALASHTVPAPIPHHVWHQRLSHPASSVLNSLVNNKLISCTSSSEHLCNVCQLGKHVKQPFVSAAYSTVAPSNLIFSDVWESPILSPTDIKHYIVFIDAYSRYSCLVTPQQNGVAEKKHRHIAEKIRCLLFQSQLPPIFWVEALNYVFPTHPASLTTPTPLVPTHAMITRLRNGISKPKQIASLTASHISDSLTHVPTCYYEAIKSSHWL